MQTWTASRFRSSPRFELRRLEELPPEQQSAFRELQNDDDFYGLLVPTSAGSASIKSVGHQAAQLFHSLARPSRIAPSLLDDHEYRDDVVDLVLDGILEIEIGGAFCFGADAFRIIASALPEPVDHGRIGTLSREAVQHAQELATTDVAELASALYCYNRIPLSRAWTKRFPDRDAVLAHIGAENADRHWSRTPHDAASPWISWQSREPRRSRGGVTWKLYVSPLPDHIRDAFAALVRVLAEIPGAQMKIGSEASGLLRPDKLVAYFDSRDDLRTAARALAESLHGCPAHGVPFTAGIDDDGLLSWGVDPPDSERALSWLDRESWRLWIAKTLAASLTLAKRSTHASVEPWRFAVERLRRRGVDVDTWTPSESLFGGRASRPPTAERRAGRPPSDGEIA